MAANKPPIFTHIMDAHRYAKPGLQRWQNRGEDTVADDRARSFIERYMVARASTFRTGAQEIEDMHACSLMAKTAYRHIANVAREAEPNSYAANDATGQAGQAAGAQGPLHSGAVMGTPGVLQQATLSGVPLESASKQSWLVAGKAAILSAISMLHHTGQVPPRNLLDAASEVLSPVEVIKEVINGKTP